MLKIFSRLSETFDRFEIKSQLKDQMLDKLNDEVDEIDDDSHDDEVIVDAEETEPIDDTNSVGNLISFDEIESGAFFTQNTPDTFDFNDG